MPAVFHCKACDLKITLGPFHGGALMAEYAGGIFVACGSCGTQFLVQVASRDRGPEYFEFVDAVLTGMCDSKRVTVMHRLRADLGLSISDTAEMLKHLPTVMFRKLPLQHARARQSLYAAAGALLTLKNAQREPNQEFGPIALDRFFRRVGPVSSGDEQEDWIEVPFTRREDSPGGEFDLLQQTCSECKSIGSFLSDMQAPPAVCPRCKKPELEYASGWVT